MKKVFVSMMIVAAMALVMPVAAQDSSKGTCDKQKTECTKDKKECKDKKADCKDSGKKECCKSKSSEKK